MFRAKRIDPSYRDNYSAPDKGQQAPVTKIIINLAPGVTMPEQVVEATEYRELPEEEG